MLRSLCFKEYDLNIGWGVFYWAKPSELEYSLEIIEAVRRGRLNDEDEFHRFCGGIRKNKQLSDVERAERCLHICDAYEDDNLKPYEVLMSKVMECANQVDELAKMEDEDEYNYAIDTLDRMQADILVRYHVSLWNCMRLALMGIPEPVDMLRKLVAESPEIKELMWIVLSSDKSLSDLKQINAA